MPVPIVYTSCRLQQAAGSYNEQIRDGFQRLKEWARQHGYDPSKRRVIGIPLTNDAQLVGYECALEFPEVISQQTEDVQTKQLPGGRYAVLSLEKDSSTIGETIGRFFAEYVPQHRLVIDTQRPSYEVYYERTMDFFVPLQ
jgi:DNA gyrase inhibitor GyrI